ncbi:MAG: hypothetical protein FWC45_00335 [Treponema sp.]|nr:hypothetical protein [Treponema sp.]
MKNFYIRLLNIIIGLFLYALGIVITIRANIGYAPWDVLHIGIANTLGLSIGTISISVGLIIIVIVKIMGERLGLGTILNILLIGIFLDIILKINIIPKMNNLFFGSIMLILGLFIISLGSYFYIKSAFGAGPRDSLMVVLARKTKIPVGICRSTIELLATLGGWLLGGMVGIGTVISVIGIGFCIQLTFKILKFDVTAIRHETLSDTYTALTGSRHGGRS